MFQKFGYTLPQDLIDAATKISEAKADEPAAPDADAIARRKRLQALKDKQEDDAAERGGPKTAPTTRTVAGTSYGGAKQKADTDMDEELKGNQHKIDANKNGKIDAHDFKLLRGKKKVEVDEAKDTVTKDTEGKVTSWSHEGDWKKSKGTGGQGKAANLSDIARRKTEKLSKEDIDFIDELNKSTLASYAKKASSSSDERSASNLASRAADKSHTVGMDGPGDDDDGEKDDRKSFQRSKGIGRAIDRLSKEEVELDERELTSGETKEKEHLVKSMKKNKAGFQARYGDRAKSVMYATATKLAKEADLKKETLMGKAGCTSEETKVSESFYNKNTHADMPASYYIAKHPEGKGPIGGHGKPLEKTTHGAQKDKALAAAKATGGKAYLVYGNKETEVNESRGHKIIAAKLAQIDRMSTGIAPDHNTNNQSTSDKLKDVDSVKKVQIVTQKDTSIDQHSKDDNDLDSKYKMNKMTHGYGKVHTSEEVETIDEISKSQLGTYKFAKGEIEDSKYAKNMSKDQMKQSAHRQSKMKQYGGEHTSKVYSKEEVEIHETATLDKYIKSMGYDPLNMEKNKKVMFAKTNAFKKYAQTTEDSKSPGQEDDVHMSPGATARG